MIIITGAAGFIGSQLAQKLNNSKINNLILVDDFQPKIKKTNWENLLYQDKIDRIEFFDWAINNAKHIDFVYHLGAKTNPLAHSYFFEEWNLEYSQKLWSFCAQHGIPLVYASGYQTYGNGKRGFSDEYSKLNLLQPETEFAKSKHRFDLWVLKQHRQPPFWAGVKFFQVYGKNEAHKLINCSDVYKITQQLINNEELIISKTNEIVDYVSINDVTKMLFWLKNHTPESSIYNFGTGFARPKVAVIDILRKLLKIENMPTIYADNHLQKIIIQADMNKMRKNAYKQSQLPLEEGIKNLFRKSLHS